MGKHKQSEADNDTPSKKLKSDLSEEELQALRKRLREKKKKLKQLPNLNMKELGMSASLNCSEDSRTPLTMKDFQSLILYSLLGTKAPVEPGRWCKFDQWGKLGQINCLAIDGMGLEDFQRASEGLKSLFQFQLEFISPSTYKSSLIEDLSTFALSSRKLRSLKAEHGKTSKACKEGKAFHNLENVTKTTFEIEAKQISSPKATKVNLLLNLNQMISENYPLPLEGPMKHRYAHFVPSKDEYEPVSESSPLFAVDCEMCLTSIGKLELTKVCVVDQDFKEVYHTFVKPKNKIVNYITKYSGVTPQMLKDVETRLEDVQNALRKMLPANAIWVGQSLGGDLRALEMLHPYVIDTSIIFNTSGIPRQKTSLKKLSQMFLGESIQDKGADGHDPKEDAIASMKLALLKLKNGLTFGDALLDPNRIMPLTSSQNPRLVISKSIFHEAMENEKKICLLATESVLQNYASACQLEVNDEGLCSFISCQDEKEVIEKSLDISQDCSFKMCHLDASNVKEDKRLAKIKKWSKRLWSQTPINGIFLTVWSGTLEQKAFVGIALNKQKISD